MQHFTKSDNSRHEHFIEGEPLASTKELAKQMAEPGLPAENLISPIRNAVRRNHISSFGVRKGEHHLYRRDQWVIAKVIATLYDAGFKDQDLMGRVSVRLQAWLLESDEDVKRGLPKNSPRSPAQRIVDDYDKNERNKSGPTGWMLRIRFCRNETSGQRKVDVILFNVVTGKDIYGKLLNFDKAATPHAEMIISIDRFLPRLLTNREAMN